MTVLESSVLVFSLVAKHNPDSGSYFYKSFAEICGDRLIEALRLGFYDSCEIEICMAFSMKTDINRVQQNCAPLAARMA